MDDDRIYFNGEGSNTLSRIKIIVEMDTGAKFVVKECFGDHLDYALKFVRKHFRGKRCYIRKEVETTYHYKTNEFIL